MNFNELDSATKEALHNELLACAMSIGGKNFFLQMIEDIKKEKPLPLVNKSAIFRYTKGKVAWNKQVYKDTLNELLQAIRTEQKEGSMFEGLTPRQQKQRLNTLKTLSPLSFHVSPHKRNEGDGFRFALFDEEKRVSFLFKTLFIHNIELTKKILNYEAHH